MGVVFRRMSVVVSFNVSARRIMNEGVHRPDIIQSKGYALVMSGVDIVKGVECRLHMSSGRFVALQSKK